MVTILRDWSYRYQWLYDAIARLAALSVGGESRFRQLALQGLTIHPETQVLELCCGSGQYSTARDGAQSTTADSQRSLPGAKTRRNFYTGGFPCSQ